MTLGKRPRLSRRARAALAWGVIGALATGVVVRVAADAGAQDRIVQSRGQGELLYSQECAQCHGAEGNGSLVPGTDRRAPALRGLSVAYMDLVMRTGRMPPPENNPFDNRARQVAFSDEEREAIVSYLERDFELTGDLPEVSGGEAAKGREVFEINCAACHGATGSGGVAGQGAFTPGVTGYEPVAIAEAIRVGPFQMPAFGSDQISQEEAGDIAAFLEEVESEDGTLLGLVELNPVYASGFVILLALVALVSLTWIGSRPPWFPDPERSRGQTDPERSEGPTDPERREGSTEAGAGPAGPEPSPGRTAGAGEPGRPEDAQ